MYKIFTIFCMFLSLAAHAYTVCGPDVDGLSIAYTDHYQQEGVANLANWAVGTGCVGAVDSTTGADTDIRNLCTSVVAGGWAMCGQGGTGSYSTAYNMFNTRTGNYCWCARSVLRSTTDGELSDSMGQWVLLGGDAGNDTLCLENCARLCAENVATNIGNMRNAIMTLPAI